MGRRSQQKQNKMYEEYHVMSTLACILQIASPCHNNTLGFKCYMLAVSRHFMGNSVWYQKLISLPLAGGPLDNKPTLFIFGFALI